MAKAICPGSFDPVTRGHIDIIARASGLFDEVVALVVVNPVKVPCFTAVERAAMLRRSVAHLPNVSVDIYQGLLANYVRQVGAVGIVKGLRAMSDFEYEFQMTLTNHKLLPQAETIFLSSTVDNLYLSSSLVKQVAQYQGSIVDFVPPEVLPDIEQRLGCRSPTSIAR